MILTRNARRSISSHKSVSQGIMAALVVLLTFILGTPLISQTQNEIPPINNGVSHELAKWRAFHYSDVRYTLNLTIEKKAQALKGTIIIRLKVREKDTPIILDWRKIRGHENLSKVSNVSINGTKLRWNPGDSSSRHPMYETVNEHLVFKDGVKTGENNIILDFESPILKSGSAITRYIDKEDGSEYIYSLFVPSDASTAFPVFDQPDLKAGFRLKIIVPVNWKVITNSMGEDYHGLIEGPPAAGQKIGKVVKEIFSFETTKPISTYVFAFAAGKFTEFIGDSPDRETAEDRRKENLANRGAGLVRSSTSNIYVRKSQAKKFEPHASEIFRLNRESIKFFEEYFDYKFPFPKYDLVLIPEFPFGGMEHAGATFLRESSMIFPTEPTANNYISRASLLLHENAHQWFGDTVTMKWFDDLWLKEGFATFMAYKAMEKVMPEYDAWKVFYQRTKPRAYGTDVTKGTTPIYQKIPNLNSAKSAYGNIVYNKAPGFLKQAEFYLGEKEFQTAVRNFLKDHEYANAEWSDLVSAFEKASGKDLTSWADTWVKKPGLPIIRLKRSDFRMYTKMGKPHDNAEIYSLTQRGVLDEKDFWDMKTNVFLKFQAGATEIKEVNLRNTKRPIKRGFARYWTYINSNPKFKPNLPVFVFPNYKDRAYGIFLLDPRSRKYALENIQNEKDDFLRSMIWGALWDSVRFAELDPKEYIDLAIKNIGSEKDVTTISSILGRVNTAFTRYLSNEELNAIAPKLEKVLLKKMRTKSRGRQITFYRSFLNLASTPAARKTLKGFLKGFKKERKPKSGGFVDLSLRTKDKFDIVTRLIILGDEDGPRLLADLERTEKGDAAKRYAYAAKAGIASKENKAKYWNDFVNNKDVSESWIENAARIWNSTSHSELTLPYLERALAELPNHKLNRKIFFVNGWTASFIGGQKSEEALGAVNKFLVENPNLDVDLKRKILERLDGLERAVKIRRTFGKQ